MALMFSVSISKAPKDRASTDRVAISRVLEVRTPTSWRPTGSALVDRAALVEHLMIEHNHTEVEYQ